MYKGTMDKDNEWGGLNVGRRGVGRARESSGEKGGQLQSNNNKIILKKLKTNEKINNNNEIKIIKFKSQISLKLKKKNMKKE